MKVALSAGHYKTAPGACSGDFCEHPEAVLWVQLIAHYLDEYAEVYIAPVGRLGPKVTFINFLNVDLAIEIHFNACGGCGAKGSETLYCPGSAKGKPMAEHIQKRLATVFKPNRGVKEGWFKMDRPGIVDYPGDVDGDENPDYFLRETNCPAIIIEPEFIHNQAVIQSKRDEACQEIALGIIEALV